MPSTINPQDAYNAQLGAAQAQQQRYNAALAGYQRNIGRTQSAQNLALRGYSGLQKSAALALQQQQLGQQGILKGYQQGYQSLLGGLEGSDASERQRISDEFAAQRGQSIQSLTDRGLGNTTVVDAVQRGLDRTQDRANLDLTSRFAQMRAGYAQDYNQQRFGAQRDFLNQNSNLRMQALGFGAQRYGLAGQYANQLGGLEQGYLSAVGNARIPYPSPGDYGLFRNPNPGGVGAAAAYGGAGSSGMSPGGTSLSSPNRGSVGPDYSALAQYYGRSNPGSLASQQYGNLAGYGSSNASGVTYGGTYNTAGGYRDTTGPEQQGPPDPHLDWLAGQLGPYDNSGGSQ